MNKEEIIKILKKYNFDSSEYIVISSAALVLYGIKKETKDIDIAVSKSYYKYLLENYDCVFEKENNGVKIYFIDNVINFGTTYYDRKNISFYEGFPLQSIKNIKKLKTSLNRKKDIKDIALIDKYLAFNILKNEGGMRYSSFLKKVKGQNIDIKIIDELIECNILIKKDYYIKYNILLDEKAYICNLYLNYINRRIKVSDVINELKKINIDTNELEKIKTKYKIELDNREINNNKARDNIINKLENILANNKLDINTQNNIKYHYDYLMAEAHSVRDSGPLYDKVVEYFETLNINIESINIGIIFDILVNALTYKYVFNISQEYFEKLVGIAKKKGKLSKEYLWRLSNTFYPKGINMDSIIDYYISKKDAYYLGELFSFSYEYVNKNSLAMKVLNTKDIRFINKCMITFEKLGLIDSEEINKYKKIYINGGLQ